MHVLGKPLPVRREAKSSRESPLMFPVTIRSGDRWGHPSSEPGRLNVPRQAAHLHLIGAAWSRPTSGAKVT